MAFPVSVAATAVAASVAVISVATALWGVALTTAPCRRVLLSAVTVGDVAPTQASSDRTDDATVGQIVTRDTSDDRTLDAAFGLGLPHADKRQPD